MQNFEDLYHILFNACTDAINALDNFDFLKARNILVDAQQTAEQRYIDSGFEYIP